jgi:hypothetical protein
VIIGFLAVTLTFQLHFALKMLKYSQQPCAKKDVQEQYDETSLKHDMIDVLMKRFTFMIFYI